MVADEQLAAYLAGEMPDGDRADFEAAILADEAARRELLAQRKVSAGLRALLGGDHERLTQAILTTTRGLSNEAIVKRVVAYRPVAHARPAYRQPQFQRREVARRSWWIPLTAAAAVAIAAIVSWKGLLPRKAERPVNIAMLTRAADAVWADAASAPPSGRALRAGWLRLKSGVVEVEFSRGARAVIEGPAEFQLVSGNEGNLRFGKLWARVPPSAHGFRVSAPGFTAVDLGTEFGCKVLQGGPAEVHVFEGAVQVRDAAAETRQMRANEGVEFIGAAAREIPAQRSAFLGADQLPQHTAFLRGSRTEQDIGNPGKRGSSSVDSRTGVWTVAGGGADINGVSDQFHFVSQDFSTDGTIVAKVSAVEKTDDYSKAGLMIRGSMSADAPYAFVFFGPSTVGFEFRTAAGGDASHAPWSQTPYVGFATAPMWVKLVRRGGVFAAYYGKDGVTWTQLGAPATIVMSVAARAGLAVTAHNDAALNHSTFENVTATAQP